MGAAVSALLFAWIAHVGAFVLTPQAIALNDRLRWVGVWMFTAGALFVIKDPGLLLLLSLVAVFSIAPAEPIKRVAFFLVLVPCLPFETEYIVPFPGIHFLTVLTPYKAFVLAALLPLLLHSSRSRRVSLSHDERKPLPAPALSISEFFLVCFIFYTAFTVTGAINATSGLRFLIDQILMLGLPYFIIRTTVRRTEDFDLCAIAILAVSIILAAIAVVATFKQWDFYRLNAPPTVFSLADERSGFVRIGATTGTHSLGFLLVIGLLLLQYLKNKLAVGWILLNTIRAFFLVAIYFTDSRAAMVSLGVGALVYAYCTVKSTVFRFAMRLMLVTGAAVAAVWLTTGDFSELDPHDTFSYRQELLTTSLAYIADYPLFGDYHYLLSGRFNHLIQGQGIVDITNLYLQIALPYGLLGLALLFAVFIAPLRGVFRNSGAWHQVRVQQLREAGRRKHRSRTSGSQRGGEAPLGLPKTPTVDDDLVCANAALAGALVGWFVLVATTSDTGITIHFGIVLAALARGWNHIHECNRGNLPAVARAGEVEKSQTTMLGARPAHGP